MTAELRAAPGAGWIALAGLMLRSGALRHPLRARDAARRGLPGVIALAAARDPERVALTRDEDEISAGALDAEVRAMTAQLGRRAGQRIGVRSDGGIGFVATVAAALAAGADVVPLGPRLAPADVEVLGLDDILDPGRTTAASPIRTPDAAGRLLLLTTGTTGSPVATGRGRLGLRALAQLADADRRIGLPPGPLLLLAPPDHGHGMSALLAALLRGVPVVLGSGRTPEEQAALVTRHAVASISGVPAQLARLLDAGGIGTAQLVVSGSSPLPAPLRQRLEATGATVRDGFGSTATGTVAIDGRPLAGVRMRRAVGGILEVRSPLGGNRFVATGDRVEFAHGRVLPLGRAGNLVDSGGELLDPRRLHTLLSEHPGVRAAAVHAVDDDLLGTVLHARVDADPALEAQLREAIAATLSRAEHPRRLEFGEVTEPSRPGSF
jgi:acyl-CoA synthetase (AMP-forming)/AMP-acid ligase II